MGKTSTTLLRCSGALIILLVSACSTSVATTTTGAGFSTPITAAPTTTTAPPPSYPGLELAAGGCDYGGALRAITAVDEHTVRFDLCAPDAAFPAKAALTAFGIQPAEHLEATAGAPLRNPIGTGPYRLVAWHSGESIVYERNDTYYGERAPHATAVLRWGTEDERVSELVAGTIDGTTLDSDASEALVGENSQVVVMTKAEPDVLYVAMTNTFEPFDNPVVRRAVAMGIDREQLVERFYPPGSEVASYFTPCSVQNGCRGAPWYQYDPDAARELLETAGYEDGFTTRIYYRDIERGYLPDPDALAFELSDQLRENLNIDAEVIEMESDAFVQATASGNLEGVYLFGWTGAIPHITHFLGDRFEPSNPQFGSQDPSYTEPLEEAAMTTDDAVAAALYAQANSAIREFVPMVPIVHTASAFAYSADVAGAQAPSWGPVRLDLMDNGRDRFVFMQANEPSSLYCADEADSDSFLGCAQVVESLYSYSPGGELQPQLATACIPTADLTTWECELRSDVVFHDGTTLDANDVVVSWSAGLDASSPLHTGNTGAWTFYRGVWGSLIHGGDGS